MRIRIGFFLLLTLGIQTIGCGSKPKEKVLSYLALGDSYTIGERVSENERWPVQLASALKDKGFPVSPPKIIAKTGWRSDNLLAAIAADPDSKKYDLVSLSIGVNNQFQGKNLEEYRKDLGKLFEIAISKCAHGKRGVFVVSIPDYGATPFGKPNATKIGAELDQWNAILKEESDQRGIPFYDITPISRQNPADTTLVAADGLHPSGKQYGLWVDSFIGKLIKVCNALV